MNYSNGETIRLGDLVKLGVDDFGIVVCDVDGDAYAPDFPREDWKEVLGGGVLIKSQAVGLIQLAVPNEDLELMRRAEHGNDGAEDV